MANNCYNSIIITGITQEQADKLLAWVESYAKFNYMNDWVESFISKEHQLKTSGDQTTYGARWFECEFTYDDETGELTGDSAWGPMENLAQVLSAELQCHVEIDYEEPGCDFGGRTEFQNGTILSKLQTSYMKYRYNECGDGYEFLESELDCFDPTEENWNQFAKMISDEKLAVSAEDLQKLKDNFLIPQDDE